MNEALKNLDKILNGEYGPSGYVIDHLVGENDEPISTTVKIQRKPNLYGNFLYIPKSENINESIYIGSILNIEIL